MFNFDYIVYIKIKSGSIRFFLGGGVWIFFVYKLNIKYE